jgi:hypothetical protein
VTGAEVPGGGAWLDAQRWTVGACARCDHLRVQTMAVGHVEGNSGPGYEIRFCRACVLVVLAGARAEQARGYRPRLPPALADAVAVVSRLHQAPVREAPAPDSEQFTEDKARVRNTEAQRR